MGLAADLTYTVSPHIVGATQKAKLRTTTTCHAITALVLFNTMFARRTASDLVRLQVLLQEGRILFRVGRLRGLYYLPRRECCTHFCFRLDDRVTRCRPQAGEPTSDVETHLLPGRPSSIPARSSISADASSVVSWRSFRLKVLSSISVRSSAADKQNLSPRFLTLKAFVS
jgi:hypothetical protein